MIHPRSCNVKSNFYPRSPCGERQQTQRLKIAPHGISIHALLAESDPPRVIREPATSRFLSTLSLRRATVHYDNYNLHCVISIHALLAESDVKITNALSGLKNFYPRSPCGERQIPNQRKINQKNFYPRSPCGERPPCCGWLQIVHYFYPRSPCGERRLPVSASTNCAAYFYPRSPCGERLCLYRLPLIALPISIHALLAESDLFFMIFDLFRNISIHALLAESDSTTGILCFDPLISIHALLAESDQILDDTSGATGISIHALLAESDQHQANLRQNRHRFLSTLSLRRATFTSAGRL